MKVLTGLDVLVNDKALQKSFKGNVALLCHNASVDAKFTHAALKFKEIFGNRFIKLFGPQHGFATDVQDNMIETDHSIHPYFKIPVYSLYSETRIPTDEMLEGIDHLFVDLQDVGCRIYTYIYTLTLMLEKCSNKEIEVCVLDRPNPINGIDVEGNVLDLKYRSFVGRHPMPFRHAMTMGEVGLMHQKFWAKEQANYRVIKMEHWSRNMYFSDTKLPWLLPSPNLPRAESTLTFPATVLFEGTLLSEGRGTTQSLEIVGHSKIEPFSFYENHLKSVVQKSKLKGFVLRPVTFLPTFQKQANKVCGGVQVHITNRAEYRPWRLGQLLLREFYHYLGKDFEWKKPPYEYNYTQHPIDIINGTDKLRFWVENNDALDVLDSFEDLKNYNLQLREIKIY
ncbi:exo-beta-N-acetylmuramidase NamZ domain-containing protein [Tenacibaculum sp. UWU-22]|uniref:exo-beta-N-acetylmuramidase NamZ family protein n=1 Tax=Tenacibaculum sp. UWU-22 TaxID=3234187 RepID=UPI0034DB522E